jgi:hypothetical protein
MNAEMSETVTLKCSISAICWLGSKVKTFLDSPNVRTVLLDRSQGIHLWDEINSLQGGNVSCRIQTSPYIQKTAGSDFVRLRVFLLFPWKLISFLKVNVQSAAHVGLNTVLAVQYHV